MVVRKQAIEAAYGVGFDAFVPVADGKSSLNYKATIADKSYLVKLTGRATAERLQAIYSKIDSPLVPKLAFGGEVKEIGEFYTIVVEWCETGAYVDPLMMTSAHLDSFLSAHREILRAMRGLAAEGEGEAVIHGDLNFRNVLFHGTQVAAIIDFECVRRGHPTEDLVYTFIHANERTRFWKFRRVRALERHLAYLVAHAGYSLEDWLKALALHEGRKCASRRRKAKVKILAELDCALRHPFYAKLRRIIECAGKIRA